MSEPPKTTTSLKKIVQKFNQYHHSHKHDTPEVTAALLGTSYAEQHLSIEQISEVYSDSYIDVENPEKSDGLSEAEASARFHDGGPNRIPSAKSHPAITLFFKQFLHEFWILLLIAAILCFIVYGTNRYYGRLGTLNLYCGIILVAVIISMSLLSFWEQTKVLKVMNNFQHLVPEKAYVLRDAVERYINCEDIVVGDIVVINSGKMIPADIRILKANGLKIDGSIITGQRQAVDYISEAVPSNINAFDSRNIAFKGSYCVEGEGIGIVVRIGPYTALGHLSGIKKHIQLSKSRLQKDVAYFVKLISTLAVLLAFAIIVIGCIVANFEHLLYHISTGFVIVVVACIPQGLPALIMSQHSIIARKLAKNNIYIKKPDIIDKIGAVSLMCIDKTGILTENKLKVTSIWENGKNTEVTSSNIPKKKISIVTFEGLEETTIKKTTSNTFTNADSYGCMQ